MAFCHINGFDVYYEWHGKGDPLILVSGLSCDTTFWTLTLPFFTSNYRVLVFDNRGAGQSGVPENPYSTKIMADDVAALMDALEIPSAHLVGHSMGSAICQYMAINHPNKVRQLILTGCFAKTSRRANFALDVLTRLLEEQIDRDIVFRALVPWIFSENFLANEEAVQTSIDLFVNNPHPQTLMGYKNQMEACKSHDARTLLHKIDKPTLLYAGENDLLTPVTDAEVLEEGIASAKLKVMRGVSHSLPIEKAEEFAATIMHFIKHS